MATSPPPGKGTMGSCYPDGKYQGNGRAMSRPLYPLDIGPHVRLTDDQHVAVWLATAGLIGIVLWRLFT